MVFPSGPRRVIVFFAMFSCAGGNTIAHLQPAGDLPTYDYRHLQGRHLAGSHSISAWCLNDWWPTPSMPSMYAIVSTSIAEEDCHGVPGPFRLSCVLKRMLFRFRHLALAGFVHVGRLSCPKWEITDDGAERPADGSPDGWCGWTLRQTPRSVDVLYTEASKIRFQTTLNLDHAMILAGGRKFHDVVIFCALHTVSRLEVL
jgi:hypothetical protein